MLVFYPHQHHTQHTWCSGPPQVRTDSVTNLSKSESGLLTGNLQSELFFLSSEGRGPAQNQQNVGRVDELALHNHGLELPDVDGEGMDRYPEQRGDAWLEVRLGEFFCEGGYDNGVEMEVSVREVRRLFWKGGLIIQGIEIRPAEV